MWNAQAHNHIKKIINIFAAARLRLCLVSTGRGRILAWILGWISGPIVSLVGLLIAVLISVEAAGRVVLADLCTPLCWRLHLPGQGRDRGR